MRWFVVLVLAGCYSPPSLQPTCIRCGDGDSCPADLVCIEQLCRTSPSDTCVAPGADGGIDVPTPDNDTDDDGVANAIDKCPTIKDPLQRDHDGDNVGDLCDPCPHIASQMSGTPDTDSDGDGVGNACDSRPTINGERLHRFYGFYDGSEAAWFQNPGWTFSTGAARQDTFNQGPFVLEAPIGESIGNIEIRARIEIVRLNAGSGLTSFAGVSIRRTSSGSHRCILQTEDNGATRTVRYSDGSDSIVTLSGGPTGIRLFRHSAAGNQGVCRMDGQGPPQRVVTEPGIPSTFGIVGNYAQVNVDYILIVETPVGGVSSTP